LIKLVEEELLVRVSGAAAEMLNELVKRGYSAPNQRLKEIV